MGDCLDKIIATESNALTITLGANDIEVLEFPLQLSDHVTIKGAGTDATNIKSTNRRTFVGYNLKGSKIEDLTIGGEENSFGGGLHFTQSEVILDNIHTMKISETIQDLRVVKNQAVESILFQVPVSVEFNQKEKFRKQCREELQQLYPDCTVMIEFKSQMSVR